MHSYDALYCAHVPCTKFQMFHVYCLLTPNTGTQIQLQNKHIVVGSLVNTIQQHHPN